MNQHLGFAWNQNQAWIKIRPKESAHWLACNQSIGRKLPTHILLIDNQLPTIVNFGPFKKSPQITSNMERK